VGQLAELKSSLAAAQRSIRALEAEKAAAEEKLAAGVDAGRGWGACGAEVGLPTGFSAMAPTTVVVRVQQDC
jgi:hypothetical protein